jgi:hypothetical protein
VREQPGSGGERVGPLELTRLRKEDGRALLVFARDEPAAQ